MGGMPKLWAPSLDEHRALVRRRLVDAFVSLVEERGIDDVTISAVAKRADLARSAVYNHVDHLHDLALLHVDQVTADWLAGLAADDGDPRGAWGRLEDLVRASIHAFVEDPLAGMDLVEHLDDVRARRLRETMAPIMTHLSRVVADGVGSGEFVDEDPMELTGFVWATIGGYRTVLAAADRDAAAGADAADLIVRLLGRAIRTAPDHARPGTTG